MIPFFSVYSTIKCASYWWRRYHYQFSFN